MTTTTCATPSTATLDLAGRTDEQLRLQQADVSAELEAARAQWQHWQQACSALSNQARALAEEQDRRRLAVCQSETRDWAWLLEVTEPETEARYKAAQRAVAEVAQLGSFSGLRTSGYNPRTMQRTLKVSLYRDCDKLTAAVEQALLQLLPAIKLTPSDGRDEPYKYLGVFEASLSEHGSYHLAIDESKDRYELRVTRYGRPSTVHAASSLAELLRYVQRHCYYETGND